MLSNPASIAVLRAVSSASILLSRGGARLLMRTHHTHRVQASTTRAVLSPIQSSRETLLETDECIMGFSFVIKTFFLFPALLPALGWAPRNVPYQPNLILRSVPQNQWGSEFCEEAAFAASLVQKAVTLCFEVQSEMNAAKVGTAMVKADSTPVTAADFAIQGFVARALREKFPLDRFMGEEVRLTSARCS